MEDEKERTEQPQSIDTAASVFPAEGPLNKAAAEGERRHPPPPPPPEKKIWRLQGRGRQTTALRRPKELDEQRHC